MKSNQPTVRVSVERLDHLMNLVGELLIDQTSLADLSSSGVRMSPPCASKHWRGVRSYGQSHQGTSGWRDENANAAY